MPSTVSTRQSLKTRITLTTLLIFVASLWLLSFYASGMLRADVEQLLGDQQFSTASQMAAEIDQALGERLQTLQIVVDTAGPALARDAAAMQTYLEGLPLLQRQFNGGIFALQRDGTVVAEVPRSTGRIGVNYLDIDTIAAALREGKPTIGQPVMGKKLGVPVFHITVPIRDAQGTVIGALSGVINLGQSSFFDIITGNRYGKTGSRMLVAPQYRRVITATGKSRALEELPGPGANALLDRFMQGYEGSAVGLAPQGVEVLASAKGIATAGWYVAVSLPTAEAFAPIRAMQQRMLWATVLLTLLAGSLTWWRLSRQLAPLQATARTLATLVEAEQPPQSLPITRPDEIGQLIGSFNRLLETLAQRKEALRIAAIAFECQEGMIVTDANRLILRTNQSFTRIMGYTGEEVLGKSTAFMRSDRHPAAFYDAAWETATREGAWHAEVWHQRKNGEVFPQWLTATAVKDELGVITHYVVTHIDITDRRLQETERLRHEATQRDALVSEVHHRIKNNLQGITGLLRQFAKEHPETADAINQAIGQVQGISVIHGLQGRAVASSVRLCELAIEIANEIQSLWQTPVTVDVAPVWLPCLVAESEAVPLALILNELIVNAVKHGGRAHGGVNITLRKGAEADTLQISVTNAGRLTPAGIPSNQPRKGLQLITALMPRHGASLLREQRGDQVVTLLMLAPPVISLNQKEPP